MDNERDTSVSYGSPYNFSPKVNEQMTPPPKVEIYDLTLDENGEGMAGLYWNGDQKFEVAQMMDEMGIHRIGLLGYPQPVTDAEKQLRVEHTALAKKISRSLKKSKAWALCTTKEDLDRAIEAEVYGVDIREFVWDLFLANRKSKQEKIDNVVSLGKYAKENGLRVCGFFQNFTLTDVADAEVKEVITTIHEQVGLDEVAIVDSAGICNPLGWIQLVKTVKSWVDLPIQVHCHNHLGMGVANACVAVMAGAQVVQATVNGMGHFAGITALEEFAVALRVGFGIDLGIQYDKLFQLAKTVEKYTGVRMPPHKVATGDRAFVLVEDTDYIQRSIDSINAGIPRSWSFPYVPEFVGNKDRIVMGMKASKLAVQYNLDLMGIPATEQQINEILTRVIDKATQVGRLLEADEFEAIVAGVIGEPA